MLYLIRVISCVYIRYSSRLAISPLMLGTALYHLVIILSYFFIEYKFSFAAVMPDFAQVYSFIGSVFDPNGSGHLQKLKNMDPINMETVRHFLVFCFFCVWEVD